ncbi:serine dehydratase beta chain, partial [Petrimonas sp.]|uniref:serine dehydratase beta chain n=1 Tax=Petrimonas sp. TaxID=2023866 RepID=UPI003F5142EC
MKSLKELYRIGNGPSSSHTMGPKKAAQLFLEKNPQAAKFVVTLYGSLAATGKGHLTDFAILKVLEPHAPTTIEWLPKTFLPFHPNAMKFDAFDAEGKNIDSWMVYSVGGGALSDGEKIVGLSESAEKDIYPMTNIADIQLWCEQNGRTYWEYVEMHEDPNLWDHLRDVWRVMKAAVKSGLDNEGVLPGPLNLQRKAA